LEGRVLFARGLISIPDQPQLLRELRLRERRTARSGKDSVDHGVGGSDDYANSLFGAMYVAVQAAAQAASEPKIVNPWIDTQPSAGVSAHYLANHNAAWRAHLAPGGFFNFGRPPFMRGGH
jgi:hypothetical protein